MEHIEDSHQQVEEIWHNSNITKNWEVHGKLMKRQEEKWSRRMWKMCNGLMRLRLKSLHPAFGLFFFS